MVEETVFQIKALKKSFGTIEVLKGVDLSLKSGEITVLMGANGAGKSTLVKIVSGAYTLSSGQMLLSGRDYNPTQPSSAIAQGIVTVHQNIDHGVVGDLDVATNLTLDRLNGKGAKLFFSPSAVRKAAQKVADKVGLEVNMASDVKDLSLADRQMVAIARAMAHEPKVLILDEPTSSLSSAEANRLFSLVEKLRDDGVAILYISHRMSDIRRVADRILTLRDGVITGTFESKPLDYEGAVQSMLGKRVSHGISAHNVGDDIVFSAQKIQLTPDSAPFDMELRDGEVVAITGLVGVGKTKFAEAIFGIDVPYAGIITLDGAIYAPKSPRQAIERGVFLVAKDRGTSGIVHDLNIAQNISLPFLDSVSAFGFLNKQKEHEQSRTQIDALKIVCRDEQDMLDRLSGGNQQKVMVGRWMGRECRLFLLDEPFQGVDISARRDMASILRASAKGRATVLFLTELDEAMDVADRILVMSEHTLVGEHQNGAVDFELLTAQIAGLSKISASSPLENSL